MGRTLGFFESFPFLRMGSRPWAFVGLVALTGVCVFYPHVTMLLQRLLLKSLDLEHKILSIKFNQFEWTMCRVPRLGTP